MALKVKYSIYEILLFVIAFLFFCAFFLKAWYIPITHDESGTCLYYSQLSIKAIIFYDSPWPTNHVLNSLFIKLFTNLWGTSQIICRMPTLLFSILYLIFAVKISKHLTSIGFLRILVVLLFLSNPFVNDFFSLARGYGMAISCMLGSIYYLLMYSQRFEVKNLALCLGFSLLAIESNFTWLVYFGGLNMLLGFLLLHQKRFLQLSYKSLLRPLSVILAIDLISFLLVIIPIKKMTSTDQFQFWSGNSFFKETLITMYNDFIYTKFLFKVPTEDMVFFWSMIMGFCVFSGLGLYFYKKQKNISGFTIASLLLSFTILVNFAQFTILRTPFLTGRTAILYQPLFALLIATSISYFYLYFKNGVLVISGIIGVYIICHLSFNYNLKFFREWFYDKNTLEVIDYLKSKRKPGETIALNTNWLFHPSFNFYKQTKNLSWLRLQDYHKENQSDSLWKYYYTVSDEHDLMKDKYQNILGFEGDSRALYMLKDTINDK